MLRPKIQEIIAQSEDPEQAAFRVLKFMEEKIGLWGNGWFDDDPAMERFLEES
ncbi:hypothetical protein [Acaryochloris sp. CCMEE 5410]|uniref:hypothetical protein n=1 Tax=Acaryochloris sp. CCMEE 5410 TaxID=310037 RepID=UPI0002EC2907|nr:hypothetical protein [Acaryochloris sp. CCMEE 5410]KAI9129003.1 hypothetical protein ON05_037180 [Acaryochloris sp. CCMEE 5410]